MSSSVKRRGRDLRSFTKELAELPRVAAIDTAETAASSLTAAVQASFDAGQTAYGESRPLGAKGNKLDLLVTGRVRSLLRFVHDGGVKLRAALSTPYARYLIRFGLLPRGGDAPPARWLQLLDDAVRSTLDRKSAEL